MSFFSSTRLGFGIGAAAVLLAGCGGGEARSGALTPAVSVRTLVVKAVREPERLELSGRLQPAARFEVASKISGRIMDLPVTEGTAVRAGDLLVRLDAPEVRAALAEAGAAEVAARLQLETARRQADRFRRLAAGQVVTARDLELAELEAAGAESGFRRAQAAAAAAGRNLAYAELRAPHDGVVVRRLLRAGDLATPGRPILVLEDDGKKEVQISLPADLGWPLKPGDPARIEASGHGGAVTAVVDRVVPGAARHTIEAYLTADSLDAPTGTFVRAVLSGRDSVDVLRVPEEARVMRGPLAGVFAVHDGRAALRWLRLDAAGRILAGIAPGDTLILAPPADLQGGDRVDPS